MVEIAIFEKYPFFCEGPDDALPVPYQIFDHLQAESPLTREGYRVKNLGTHPEIAVYSL